MLYRCGLVLCATRYTHPHDRSKTINTLHHTQAHNNRTPNYNIFKIAPKICYNAALLVQTAMTTNTKINLCSIVFLTFLSAAIVVPEPSYRITYSVALLPALWLAQYHRFSWRFAIVLLFLFTLYSPVALTYGRLNLSIVSSALDTNVSETKEFFLNLTWKHYITTLAYALLAILYYRSSHIRTLKHKYNWILIPLCIYALSVSWPGTLIRDVLRHTPTTLKNAAFSLKA